MSADDLKEEKEIAKETFRSLFGELTNVFNYFRYCIIAEIAAIVVLYKLQFDVFEKTVFRGAQAAAPPEFLALIFIVSCIVPVIIFISTRVAMIYSYWAIRQVSFLRVAFNLRHMQHPETLNDARILWFVANRAMPSNRYMAQAEVETFFQIQRIFLTLSLVIPGYTSYEYHKYIFSVCSCNAVLVAVAFFIGFTIFAFLLIHNERIKARSAGDDFTLDWIEYFGDQKHKDLGYLLSLKAGLSRRNQSLDSPKFKMLKDLIEKYSK